MSKETITKEIKRQKQLDLINKNRLHKQRLQEVRKDIPKIADKIEKIAIHYAKNNINIVVRGFIKKRKYVRVTLNNESLKGQTYQTNYYNKIISTPEIDNELVSAIISKGFENVHVSRNTSTDIFIEAWLDIT